MANLFIIWDEDVERRKAFCEAALKEIAPFPDSRSEIRNKGNWSVLWAAGPRSPIDIHETESELAVIWGRPVDPVKGENVNAETLLTRWGNVERDIPKAMDGYHAAGVFRKNDGVALGVDLIGTFPLRYAQLDDVLLMGSSPELFRLHPCFKTEFNPLALTDILLNMFGSLGEALWKGITRLRPGRLLVREARGPLHEIEQYVLPAEIPTSEEKLNTYVDRLDAALEEAMRRIVPASRHHALMLSGGIDSRLVAGYLGVLGVPTHALTMGIPTDLEMQCAMRVADALELPHSAIGFSEDEEVAAAKTKFKWEHGLAGFASGAAWALATRLNEFDPDITSAYFANDVVSLKCSGLRYPPDAPFSFNTAFGFNNQFGLNPDVVRRLVRPEVLGTTVDEVLERTKQLYESYSDDPFIRTRNFQLHTRQRCYTGSVFWPHSFGSWPAAPMLEQNLIHVGAIIPADVANKRRVEKALLVRRFPTLASIPLDRNTFDTSPVLVPPLQRLLGRFIKKLDPADTIKVHHLGQLYYQRLLNFNGPAWRTLRREAESCRHKVLDLFDDRLLREILPGPEETVPFAHPIKDSSSRKTLAGFILWAKTRL